MKRIAGISLCFVFWWMLIGIAEAQGEIPSRLEKTGDPSLEEMENGVCDPFEPINRVFYHFNDRFYFWLLKPVSTGYKAVVPRPVRSSVANFFDNVAFPVRFLNCLLQGKLEGAGYELIRFTLNTTLGLGGFADAAKWSSGVQDYAKQLGKDKYEEDLGQTLGTYGMGHGFFILWPILGPSSLRDTFGMVGDGFLGPVNYLELEANAAVRAFQGVNRTSLVLGEYEDLKASALDPYVALRDAYYQYRKKKVEE